MKRLVCLLAIALFAHSVGAEIRPFTVGSLQTIQSERAGRPFILAFWSSSCTHCPQELRTLGELTRRHPRLDIVLVAADTPDQAPQLAELARGYGLGKQAQWVFADEQPERLRFEIDRRWYGELPRTYLYNAQHQREARVGIIPAEALERWVREQVK